MDLLTFIQLWCFAFALFAAVSSFTETHYPDNDKKWTSAGVAQIIGIATIVASSVGLFETYRVQFGGSSYG